MNTFRFRIILQHENDDIFRDIDIETDATLESLHYCIQEAFEFDNSQMASFYLSNDAWEKGEEITLLDMNELGSDDDIRMMNETIIGKTFVGEGDKVLYIFDFMNIWKFHIELVQIGTAKNEISYPAIVNVVGQAPSQYSKSEVMQQEETVFLDALKEEDRIDDDLTFQDDIFEGFDDFNLV